MSKEYPLYPELPEPGKEEAAALIEKFKKQMQNVCEDVLGHVYTDIVPHIESDSWSNYRNAMMAGFRNYANRKVQGEYDFKEIRQQIFYQFREDIIKDLDQDNLAEIQRLKDEVKHLREMLTRDRY